MPKQIMLPFGDDDLSAGEELQDELERGEAATHEPPPEMDEQAMAPPLSNAAHPVAPITPFREFDLTLLALSHIRGVGLKTLRTLYEHLSDLTSIWSTPPEALVTLLQRLKVKDSVGIATAIHQEQETLRANAQRDLYRLRGEGVQIIARHDPLFPRRLDVIPDGPRWLFVEGNPEALHTPLIGIVGTRTPSPIGIQAAERLTAVICREGFGVVSGLAEGIDAAAHRVALYYRAPQVAVLGTGIDIVFPASTEGVRRHITATGGAVITEYLPGDNYSRANFVQRNRLQAALAQALCPVESQEQSGTAHTVRFTLQYHRPLFGVKRGQAAPQNDMVNLLAAGEHPVFDLEQRNEVQGLLAWLHAEIPVAEWPTERRQVDGRAFFTDILRLVDDVLDDVPITPQDLTWLQEQLAHRLNDGAAAPSSPSHQRRGRR